MTQPKRTLSDVLDDLADVEGEREAELRRHVGALDDLHDRSDALRDEMREFVSGLVDMAIDDVLGRSA